MRWNGSPRAGRCEARIRTATSGVEGPGSSGRAVDSMPMGTIRIVDVTDVAAFDRIPPCADARFDHRSCDYWEDADRGTKAARVSWLKASAESRDKGAAAPGQPSNPFLADLKGREPSFNPFATERPTNPFLTPGDDDTTAVDN